MHAGRPLTPADYWLMVRRHKSLLAGLFLTVFFGMALWGLSLPDVYRATTMILVESQKIPASYVKATVSASMRERLRTISQQILSRTRLERVINELGLLDDPQNAESLDRYVGTMRQQTTIDVKGHGNAFSISYEGEDPIAVTMIANKLASLFIEENLKVREEQAIGTTEFLDRELQRVRGLLVGQERSSSEFKHKYMGELPEQQNANLRTLDRLQFQLQANQLAIDSARSRKSLLLNSGPQGLSPQQRLAARRTDLAKLQRHYTDAYPDVKRLKYEIAELEAQLANPPDKSAPPEPAPSEPMQLDAVDNGRLPWRLQQDLNEIDLQIQRLTRQQDIIREQIADYEQRVANIPAREQELMELTRDYKSTRHSYNSLLDRQMQAEVAENLEKRQKAEQFKILDPARTPTRPWKPNRQKIVLMGLLLGLGVGCGAVFLVEYLDPALRDPGDLKQLTGLPVLGAVSQVIAAADLRRQRLRKGLCFTAWLLIPAAVLAGVHVFWMQLDQLAARSLQLFQL